jgi:serine/threonine protein kinase
MTVSTTVPVSCNGAHIPSEAEVGADLLVAGRDNSGTATFTGSGAVVAVGPLAGYRLLDAPVDDGILAIAPAVREIDGTEVTVRVVVAELTKAQLKRFRNEAAELDRMLAETSNPYVLSLRDHARDSTGRPFLVTDRRGCPLSEELVSGGPLRPAEALGAVREAAAGLQLLHQAELTHGAISPATLLRQPTGRVVLDCPPLPVLVELVAATSDGTGHEPPEVLRRGEDWTPRGEVYALASTLCTLLTGQQPLPGSRATRWREDHEDVRLDRLPVAVSGLRGVLRSALADEPGLRPSSMEEFARELRIQEGDCVPEAVFAEGTRSASHTGGDVVGR